MVGFESTGLKKLLLNVIKGIIVEEILTDKEIIFERQAICADCDYMDSRNMMCTKCGCFLELKCASKVNKKSNGQSEITHCPINKWLDEFSKFGYDTEKNKSKQS